MSNYIFIGTDFFFSSISVLESGGYIPCAIFTSDIEKTQYTGNERCVDYAKENDIPVFYNVPSSEQINSISNDYGADLYIVAAYPYKLPSSSEIRVPGFNIHPSPLPIGRGPFPFPHAILKKFNTYGITYHKLSSNFDKGDILSQNIFQLSHDETLDSIVFKCREATNSSIVDVVRNVESLYENALPQGSGQYWPQLLAKDRLIKNRSTVDDVNLLFRAFGKNGIYFEIDDVFYCATQGRAWHIDITTICSPNRVLYFSSTEVCLKASDGVISISNYFKVRIS